MNQRIGSIKIISGLKAPRSIIDLLKVGTVFHAQIKIVPEI
jgi:hypothetical protein